MENLTHSLIGLVAGESIARITPAREPGLPPQIRRGLFVTLFVIGGNLPDLDLVYSFRRFADGTQAKLAYMLQHRGYTHTVVGCVLLALLLYICGDLWARRNRLMLTPRDRWELAGVCLLGTLLHLGMDFLNSYGVHPFWPVRDQWVYGDSVFIVEPFYWVAVAPLLFVVRSTTARIVLSLVLLAVLVVSVLFASLLPMVSRVGLWVLMIGLIAIGSRISARAAAITSATVMILITAAFIIFGRSAAHRVESIAAVAFPSDRVIDHVLTPLPADPLCWDVLILSTNGDRYSVRHAMLASVPPLIPADRCPRLSGSIQNMAPMDAIPGVESSGVHWLGEFHMSSSELATLVARHCDAAALMQFARAPFASEIDRHWILGDFRFAGDRGSGMATISLGPPSQGVCRPSVPWIPPREELLRASRVDVAWQGHGHCCGEVNR
jgi:inner membrane protein